MAATPIYCTHTELKRVFPQLNEFDGKKAIYGWKKMADMTLGGSTTDDYDLYYTHNTGQITQLYWDGAELENFTLSVNVTQTATDITTASTQFSVDEGHDLDVGDIISILEEYMLVVTVSTNIIVVHRGYFDTPIAAALTDSVVNRILNLSDHGLSTHDAKSLAPLKYFYDRTQDFVFLVVDGAATDGADPNDHLLEAGEDFSDLVTQYRTDASKYLDSRLDPNLPKNQFKDKSGNFDYMIVRTTALIAATFMIKTKDPTSEIAIAFMEEVEKNIEDMNNGNASLSWQNTSDSSRGFIRDIQYTDSAMRPVDTRGRWNGTFDLIKIKITKGGDFGTAKYSVWVKATDKLGMNEGTQVVTDEVINGDYQGLAGGLEIRFAGTDFNSAAVLYDTWEVEVAGWGEEVDSNSLKNIRMTRKH